MDRTRACDPDERVSTVAARPEAAAVQLGAGGLPNLRSGIGEHGWVVSP
jgi:hypothetical protein